MASLYSCLRFAILTLSLPIFFKTTLPNGETIRHAHLLGLMMSFSGGHKDSTDKSNEGRKDRQARP